MPRNRSCPTVHWATNTVSWFREVFSPVTGIELTWTTQTCSAEPSTAHWSCLCSSSLLTATQLYSVSNQIEEISDYQWPGILVSHEHSLCLLWVPPGRKHLVSVECMTTAKLEYNSFRSHTRLNLLVCRKSEKDLGRDQKHDNQTKALPEIISKKRNQPTFSF